MKIEIEGKESSERIEAAVIEAVVDRFTEALEARVSRVVDGAIKSHMEAALNRLTEEAIRPLVAAAVAEGWNRTDNYGNPSGSKVSAKERISDMLTRRDPYDNRGQWIDEAAKARLDEIVKKEFEPVLADARKKLKAQVDEVLASKISETVRAAVGLKA